MAEISSIATYSPMTLKPTDPLRQAIETMSKKGFRRLPVVFEYEVVGIVTASDVVRVLLEGKADVISSEIFNFMTEQPLLFYQDAEIRDAISFMFENDLSSLPLVSNRDHLLTGIVTERDLVTAFVHSLMDADLEDFIDENPIKMSMKNKKLGQCMQKMVEKKTSRIIFVNSKNKVEGIITTKDIIKYYYNEILTYGQPPEDILDTPITKLATIDLHTANVNQSVSEVARFMLESKIGGMPVVDDEDNFVGMFTERDILKLIGTYGLF